MEVYLKLLIVFAAIKCNSCADVANSAKKIDCDSLGILIYEDLGCKPKYSKNQVCPSSYQCIDYERSEEYCIFRGKKYENNVNLNYSSGCLFACSCRQDFTLSYVDCAIPKCGFRERDDKLCYPLYNAAGCCPIDVECHNVTTCVVEGKSYRRGEQFYPTNTCFDCACQSGFKGIFEEPYCKRRQCNLDIRNPEQIEQKCAPLYPNQTILCCPDSFICQTDVNFIKMINSGPTSSKANRCSFGNAKYNVNDKFEVTFNEYGAERNAICTCRVPPLLTCTSV